MQLYCTQVWQVIIKKYLKYSYTKQVGKKTLKDLLSFPAPKNIYSSRDDPMKEIKSQKTRLVLKSLKVPYFNLYFKDLLVWSSNLE